MTTQNKNVPALRFPEFNDDWEKKSLGDISDNVIYGMNSSAIKFDGINKYIRITDIDEDSRKFVPKPLTSPDGNLEKKYNLKEGDLLFARTGASVGKSYIYKKSDGNLFFAGFLIRFSISNANAYFVYSQTLKESFNKWVKSTSMRSGQPGINAEEYKTLKLNIPTLAEQQKIAEFLTSIDEKIQQLAKKKELLERYKKGAMQKIFNQEIRFKDDNGNDFADWEEKKFGQVFSFRITNSYSRDNLNYEYGGVKNIHYGDIHTKFKALFDITKEKVPFINKEISLRKIAEDNYCKEGDLVIADASEDYADVGKCIEITNLNNEKVIAGLHTFLARPDLYKMAIGFSGYLMKSKEIRLRIMTIAQGTKVLSISTGRLASIKLNIPSEPEQQKIADFLSAIDDKINSVNRQLEKTRTYKKGLLQRMFV